MDSDKSPDKYRGLDTEEGVFRKLHHIKRMVSPQTTSPPRSSPTPPIAIAKSGELQFSEDAKLPTKSSKEESERSPDEGITDQKRLSSGKRVLFPEKVETSVSPPPHVSHEPKSIAPKVKKWTTADLHETHDISFVILSMRDFVIYLLYLVVVMMVAFGDRDDAFNYYARILSDILVETKFQVNVSGSIEPRTFRTIHCSQHIWAFVETVLLDVLYPNGVDLKPVMEESILFGLPRLRQVRVKKNSCETAPYFKGVYKSCYDYFSVQREDVSSFGLKNSTPWQYQHRGKDAFGFKGSVATYPAGGFTFNFTEDGNFTKFWITELKNHNWVDLATRAVFIDMTLYSGNIGLFCVAKLVFEVNPVGGVIGSSEFRTMKVLKYNTQWSYVILSCELIFIIFTLYFLAEEVQLLYLFRSRYFNNVWNILDLFIVSLSLSTIAFGIKRLLFAAQYAPQKIKQVDTYVDFELVAYHQANFDVLVSILVFFSWIKLMKFSALKQSIFVIFSALGHIKLELIALTSMTLIISTGFSILGMNVFGSHVLQFNSYADSIFTLNGFYVGGFYFYEECVKARPWIAPMYFALYVLIVSIFFLNGFLALVVHGIQMSFEDEEDSTDRKYLSDLAREAFIGILSRLNLRHSMSRFRSRETLHERRLEYDSFVRILEKHGFRGNGLQMVLRQHNMKRGNKVKIEQMREAYEDICARKQLYLEVESHDKVMAEIDIIEKMVDSCDQTISDIVNRVEILSDKIAKAPRPLKSSLKK